MNGKEGIKETEVVVIGGGIIGTAIARELSKYHVDVCLVEKKAGIGFGITKGSLGLLHSVLGLTTSKLVKWWNPKGDLKAYLGKPLRLKERLNIAGHGMFLELEPLLNAKIHKCGRIMLARDEKDLEILKTVQWVIRERDGVELQLLDKKALAEKEPALDPIYIGGLLDENEFSVFPTEWAMAFADNAKDNGACILLETEIRGIEERKDSFLLGTNRGSIEARFVVNAAGLYADEIARMIGRIDWSFILWKNEMMILENRRGLRHIVSEVIQPQRPRLLAPTPEGNIQCGAYMTKSENKQDVSTTREGRDQLWTYPGLYLPGIKVSRDIIKTFASYMHFNSINPDDYLIEWPRKRFLNLISCAPGIAPSLPLAAEVVKMLEQRGLALRRKKDFHSYRPKEPRFFHLPSDLKNEKIKADPRYGRILCRCEKISEKEIREAVQEGAKTLDEVKFRTWVGMGRCQGGFCTSRVLQIMSDEMGVSPLEIRQNGADAYILRSRTKELRRGR